MTPAVREAIERVRAWSPPYQYQDAYIVLAALDKAEVEIARVRGALKAGLVGVDAASESCPLYTRSSPKHCPKCGATSSKNCGPYVTALSTLEGLARSALSPKDGAGE